MAAVLGETTRAAALEFLLNKARFQQGGWYVVDSSDLQLPCTGYMAGIKRS
jgi:hypothetical protein